MSCPGERMDYRISDDTIRIEAPFRMGFDFKSDNCGLQLMEIGSEVPLFDGLIDLQVGGYSVDKGNPYLSSRDGVLYNLDGTELIRFPARKRVDSFTVPFEVRRIGDHAFEDCIVDRVHIPYTVESVGRCAFRRSLVSEVRLPGISVIPERCFAETRCLKGLTLPPSVRVLGEGAFEYSAITTIDLTGVSEAGNSCFMGSDIQELTSTDSLKHVGIDAFLHTSLESFPGNR